ncbi:uncharacterized protein [Pyxicephalus adspersus]|uniref:uncharacterized protein isoform X3 n=1 Tax=Pyxicephalus adspersus TaxID=30357 RepID=UPI003B58E3A9
MDRVFQIIRQPRKAAFILWDWYIEMISAVLSVLFGIKISTKRVVGIYSWEDKYSYHFLCQALPFQGLLVREVRPFTITNSGRNKFTEEVSRSDFAILYHSKNRGRINITDVKDSMYDEELRHLFQVLDKQNVLVVVGDLDSATPEDKQRILQNQPLILEMARDLILFHEKMSIEDTEKKMMEIISYIDSTSQFIYICEGSSKKGFAYLVVPYIKLCNLVMWCMFKALLGQARIIHYEQFNEKKK